MRKISKSNQGYRQHRSAEKWVSIDQKSSHRRSTQYLGFVVKAESVDTATTSVCGLGFLSLTKASA